MLLTAYIHPPRNYMLPLALSAAAAICAAAVLTHTGPTSARPAISASAQSQAEYLPSVRVYVHRDSVRPGIIYARPGRLLLHVEDLTGEGASLVVERDTPGHARHEVGRVQTNVGGRRSKKALELGAGEYVFYEQTRPDIVGRLIIEPQD